MHPSYQGPEGGDSAICVVLDNPDLLSYNLTVSLLPETFSADTGKSQDVK